MTHDERISATWALLRSYADWLPSVRVWQPTGQPRGEAPALRELCLPCDGTGRVGRSACRHCHGKGYTWIDAQTRREVTDSEQTYAQLVQYRRVACDACGGSGRVSATTRRDPGMRDVLEVDGSHRAWWRQAERERCTPCRGSGSIEVVDERLTDASLRRLERDAAARRGEVADEDVLDRTIRRREEQWARGSYADLAGVLRQLEVRTPRLHAALMRHVVYEPGEYAVSDELRARIEAAVEWIAGEMPAQIRVPAEARLAHGRKHVLWRHRSEAATHQRAQRNAEIAALVIDHGQTPERVAEQHGMTARRVRQIVASAAAPTVAAATADPAVRYGRVPQRLIASQLDVVQGGAGEWDRPEGTSDEPDPPTAAVASAAGGAFYFDQEVL